MVSQLLLADPDAVPPLFPMETVLLCRARACPLGPTLSSHGRKELFIVWPPGVFQHVLLSSGLRHGSGYSGHIGDWLSGRQAWSQLVLLNPRRQSQRMTKDSVGSQDLLQPPPQMPGHHRDGLKGLFLKALWVPTVHSVGTLPLPSSAQKHTIPGF